MEDECFLSVAPDLFLQNPLNLCKCFRTNQVSFTGSKIYVKHKFSIPLRNLCQLMEFEVLSRDLGWFKNVTECPSRSPGACIRCLNSLLLIVGVYF